MTSAAGRSSGIAAGTEPAVRQPIPPAALWLGAAGLLPFVAGTLGVWLLPPFWAGEALDAQCFYGAVILSFLGAVHWGLSIGGFGAPAAEWPRLAWSVVPALVAWAAQLASEMPSLVILILGFAGVLCGDLAAARGGLVPAWYPSLRWPLSAAVILLLAGSLAKLLAAGVSLPG
jgi:hypothetical protein